MKIGLQGSHVARYNKDVEIIEEEFQQSQVLLVASMCHKNMKTK